jgi:hypothetical protein
VLRRTGFVDTEGTEFHGEIRVKKMELNRKDRKEKAQRAQSNTRSPFVLCVFLAPFAVQFISST